MSIKTFANTILKRHRYNGSKRSYENLYKRIISSNQFDCSKAEIGENKWLEKWRKYDSSLSPLSYRIFSRYIGEDINIMPLEIQKGIVEPVLMPELYCLVYSDKNIFDHLFYGINMPKTILRNINGLWYNKEYAPIINPLAFLKDNNKPEKIIIKPSKEEGGRGVSLFVWNGENYIDSDSNRLSIDLLNSKYKRDYLIQHAIKQSLYMSQFNPTSVNTLRVATYRSVKTGEIHVINAFIRMGASGSCVDNAHAGGMFVGVNKSNGILGKYACDFLGRTNNLFNTVDFSQIEYKIPNWNKICEFAKSISQSIIQHQLVALDIALDENDNPVLVEINIGGFGGWAFQFTTGSVFGEFTDEVMEYCWERYKGLTSVISLK